MLLCAWHQWIKERVAASNGRSVAATQVGEMRIEYAPIDTAGMEPAAIHGLPEIEDPLETEVIDGVAIIPIHGLLQKRVDIFTHMLGGRPMGDIEDLIRQATDDKSVNAILLHIDSPGGTVAGMTDLVDAVWAARQAKPVVAYISDLAASGGYWVASQAGHVVADRDGLVGSIGAMMVAIDTSEAASQAGVKVNVIRSGRFKGTDISGAKIGDDHLADFERLVSQIADVFIADVARGRARSVEDIQVWADGRLHVGERAVALGLIDEVGTMQDTLATLRAGSTSAGVLQGGGDGGAASN